MTKADIVNIIGAGTGLTKLETEAVVEGFLTTVIESLKEGNGIEIRGFGTYKTRKKNARNARNPKTGDKVLFLNIPFQPLSFRKTLRNRLIILMLGVVLLCSSATRAPHNTPLISNHAPLGRISNIDVHDVRLYKTFRGCVGAAQLMPPPMPL